MKKKLALEELKVKSFVTGEQVEAGALIPTLGVVCTVAIGVSVAVGCTGDCGTAINVTCARDCDFKSIPVDECF